MGLSTQVMGWARLPDPWWGDDQPAELAGLRTAARAILSREHLRGLAALELAL